MAIKLDLHANWLLPAHL